MRKALITLFIFTIVSAFGQKMPSDHFDEALYFIDNKMYDEALIEFKYIIENHPKNELYPIALYNFGYTYLLQNNLKKALPVFKSILESNFNEIEKRGGWYYG